MQTQSQTVPMCIEPPATTGACVPLALLECDPALAVWTLTADLRVAFVTPTAAEMLLGRPPESLVGRPVSELVPRPVVDRLGGIVSAVLRDGRAVVSRVFWGTHRVRSVYSPMTCRTTPGDVAVLTRPEPVGFAAMTEENVDVQTPPFEAPYAYVRDLAHLSPRELEVLAMIGEGHSRSQIANGMYRSPKTIDAHQTALRTKLKARGRVALATLARERGVTRHIAGLRRVEPL